MVRQLFTLRFQKRGQRRNTRFLVPVAKVLGWSNCFHYWKVHTDSINRQIPTISSLCFKFNMWITGFHLTYNVVSDLIDTSPATWILGWTHKVCLKCLIEEKVIFCLKKENFYTKLKEFNVSQPSFYLKHGSLLKYSIKFPLSARETHQFSKWKFCCCNLYSSCSNKIQLVLLECCSDWPISHMTTDSLHTEEAQLFP